MTKQKSKTFSSLQVLKQAQESVKSQLADKYEAVITPYVQIIQMTMTANNENEFSALKRIKENLEIYNKKDAPLLFSAALVEITQGNHFSKFVDEVKS